MSEGYEVPTELPGSTGLVPQPYLVLLPVYAVPNPVRGLLDREKSEKEQGAERFMAKWTAAEKARAGLLHAAVCPNGTGRTKERIAQSERARAGSLAIVSSVISPFRIVFLGFPR